jgi:hypothetical protein
MGGDTNENHPASSLMISLKNITDNPELYGMSAEAATQGDEYYDVIDR